MSVVCPYCQRKAHLLTGDKIYPHRVDLFAKTFWACLFCRAWAGCHPRSTAPLGRLANAELRRAKMAAHAAFDPLWKSGEMTRSEAYAWLASTLGISPANCHIGMFDVDGCKAVESAVAQREYITNMERAYPHLKGEEA